MSRTRRWPFEGFQPDPWIYRFSIDDVPADATYHHILWSGYGYAYAFVDPTSEGGRRLTAKATRDGGLYTRGHPPRDWIRYYHKRDRMKARAELYRYEKDPDHEVMIRANHRHNALYDWW